MGVSTNTSWDSFSYMLMMNHNVYTHLRSVQEANVYLMKANILHVS